MGSTPQALGSLVIEEKLSSTSSGDVLLARQPGLGRRVCVKTLRRDCLGNSSLVDRFRREARMAARVSHPNVQQVFDLFAWQGDHYLVLEHVEGESLREWLDRLGAPPPPVARDIALELARGLEALHGAGIVHADLCAEAARIGRWGEVKLGSLGWARSSTEREVPAPDPRAGAAPERAAGAAPDARSDVYALAALSAELLGGEKALRRSGQAARVLRKALDPDPAVRPAAGELRAGLELGVPDASAAAVRARIAAWLLQRPAEPGESPDPGQRRPRRWGLTRWAALAGAGTGLLAALQVSWRGDLREPPPPEPRSSPLAASARREPPSVDAGTPAPSAAAPEPARLRVAVFPWGEVRIDGGDPIVTPRAELIALAPGPHRIEIAHPTLGRAVREVSLAPGEQRTLRHVFDRTPPQ